MTADWLAGTVEACPEPPSSTGGGVNSVAVLFADPRGTYADVPFVDLWDEARDARNYAGPLPVVAHPPCARWCQLASLVQHVHGYKIGDDGGTFAAALESVRRCGGVLEHPAHTRAWKRYGLPIPASTHGWTQTFDDPGWSCYIEQEQYGHPARKPTWLYYVGTEPPPSLRWSSRRSRPDDPGWYVRTNSGGKGVVRVRHGEARMRSENSSRTPEPFRDALLALALASRGSEEPA